jgi:PAS domain S-box-containing protein
MTQRTKEELEARVSALESEVQALRQRENLPALAVIQDMTELVVRWLPDGTRLFVNDAYLRLFDSTLEQTIGTSFWPLISDLDRARVQARIASLSPEHPVSTGRHRALNGRGETFWMEWCDRVLFDEHGHIRELQSVGRDISERVAVEAQARRVAMADAVAKTSASVAHDLRNVLTVVRGFAELQQLYPGEARDTQVLLDAVDCAQALLDQLSALRYGRTTERVALDLNERVRGLIPLLTEICRDDVWLATELTREACMVLGDATQIDQVLLNLVKNASDAFSGPGAIVIRSRILARGAAEAWRCADGARVSLQIEDNAGGIAQAVRETLFDAGVSTKGEGRGLGLSNVRTIVLAHGGEVRWTANEAGTTFEVQLPLAV